MKLSEIDPELHAPLRRTPALPVQRRWARALARTGLGAMSTTPTAGVRIEPSAGVPGVRVYTPEVLSSDAALLWIHGGGYVIGRAVQDDVMCGRTAARLGIRVISVEYRLAPAHAFPLPLDDCHDAWQWLQQHAVGLGVDPARVVIGGQSAGGGLAAALVQRLHDEGGIQPMAQWLFCPMLDNRTGQDKHLDRLKHRVWNNRVNRWAWRAYLGDYADTVPYAVPARRANVGGLPPAWIGVGDVDLFLAEDACYAAALTDAGVDTTFRVARRAPHGFEGWAADTAISRSFTGEARDWLERYTAR